MSAKKFLYACIAAAVWLAVWEVSARLLGLPFALPTIGATVQTLGTLAASSSFWQSIGLSLLRILEGLLIGTAIGSLLAALSVWSELARAVISPAMTVIRCTPVASFILFLWVAAGREAVPVVIAVLMVCPVIWQSLTDGWRGLDRALDEVLTVYRVSFPRRMRLLVLPGLKAPFLTGAANAAGLAWKAGIAAEVIAYTSHSIGREIAAARSTLDGPSMMAWTLCVVALSLLLEKLIRLAARTLSKEVT